MLPQQREVSLNPAVLRRGPTLAQHCRLLVCASSHALLLPPLSTTQPPPYFGVCHFAHPSPGMSFSLSHNSLIAGVGKNPKSSSLKASGFHTFLTVTLQNKYISRCDPVHCTCAYDNDFFPLNVCSVPGTVVTWC